MNLLTDRKNQVITNFGLTNSYSVQNGIDQWETITHSFGVFTMTLLSIILVQNTQAIQLQLHGSQNLLTP